MQAMALRQAGDKTLIYQSRILGSQDTLFDHIGKPYFYQCYIQGSIDFIFGIARSLYQSIRDDRSVHIFPPFPGCDRRQQYVRVEAVTLHPGGGASGLEQWCGSIEYGTTMLSNLVIYRSDS
ncbi:Pectinesterase QRT1 [Platanthera zijinensis]|uniref:Pectinesterase n=1 Tax=Platanthera zijinensis TaxID=2320716 RepID=A0AAP0G1M4_9ASPA